MRFDYSKKFNKQFKKLPEDLKDTFRSRLELFLIDKYHPLLNNHQLNGDRKGYHSINISGDVRLVFSEKETGVILLAEIGDHHQLYGK